MHNPLYIAGLLRAELQRARSMAQALARNIALLLESADAVLPFALTQLDDVLADDVIRLLGCLERAHDEHGRLSEGQIVKLALGLAEAGTGAGHGELAA